MTRSTALASVTEFTVPPTTRGITDDAPREPLVHRDVENHDGSWIDHGPRVGAPIELGS